MNPALNVTTLDGNLGTTIDTTKVIAMAGICSSGTANVPVYIGRVQQAIDTFGTGPLVDAICFSIAAYGIPVLACRVAQTADGECSAITKVGSGTSTVTISGTETPNNDYEPYLECATAGTIGTDGIEVYYSLDGGYTKSVKTALGTANTFTFPNAGGVVFALGTGTMAAGDTFVCQAVSATWVAADLTDAVEALGMHSTPWDFLMVVGNATGDDFDAVELALADLYARGRDVRWMCGYRMPEPAESEATYLAAAVAEFGTRSVVGRGVICYGACRITSAVDSAKYRRSPLVNVGPFSQSVSEEIDIADTDLGPLITCSITDQNGNHEEHDELIDGGADDAGFLALRTWSGKIGVYVNNPRCFVDASSDFLYIPNRRVVNLALQYARAYFLKVLSKPLRVNKTTGYIKETEARRIEKGATRYLEGALLGKPKASSVQVTLSRTDNILSTKTLTVDIKIVPLAYPKTINLSIGLYNPALVTIA